MLDPSKATLAEAYTLQPRRHIWQFAEADVDFDLVPLYDVPPELSGPYDASFAPYMKEPVEAILDPTVREIWFRKPSRFGASESLTCNGIRFIVAEWPRNCLFLSCDQLSSESYFNDRIKLGLRCSEKAAAKLDRARELEHEVYFENMVLRCGWPRAKGIFKQFGWAVIFVEECSLLPNTAPGMIRKRTDTYAECKIIFLSSPDPQQKRRSSEDPIFYEMEETDQRHWFIREPKYKRARYFEMVMGTHKTPYGLKWNPKAKRKDGSWDLQRVFDSAHYITPAGSEILNRDRLKMAYASTSKWRVTNKRALRWKRGYVANCFISPFKNGDFGEVAVAFLEAKKAGLEQLRTFVYEYEAREWTQTTEQAKESVIHDREADYKRGETFNDAPGIINIYAKKRFVDVLTIDVQKTHLWWLVRRWLESGDSGLRDWGPVVAWKEVEELIGRFEIPKGMRLIDNSYTGRRVEVLDWCVRLKMIPCYGRDTLKSNAIVKNMVDPYEGTAKQSRYHKIPSYTFNPNMLKARLLTMMRGKSEWHWFVYNNVEYEYTQQVTAEKSVDGVFTPIRKANHMFDLEVLQTLAARVGRFLKIEDAKPKEDVELSEAQEAQSEKKRQTKAQSRAAWIDPNSIRL